MAGKEEIYINATANYLITHFLIRSNIRSTSRFVLVFVGDFDDI